MKKSIVLIIALLVCGSMAFAQNAKSFYKTSYESRNSGSFDQSASLLSFGIGFPNVAPGYGGNSGFPPLYVKYEHGFLRDDVGLGGYVSTGFGETGKYNYGFGQTGYQTNFFAFSIAILGYYHFNKLIPIEQMDVYAGAGLAFKNVTYDDNDNFYDDDATITVPVKVGIRYYVKPSFAFYAESGWDGMSGINLGVTLKLN